jgi:Putative prokaryotic signal transducing protein
VTRLIGETTTVGEPVRLTMVPNEGEAEILCGILRVEGIRCAHRITDLAHDEAGQAFGGWREVLVAEADYARALELLPRKE